MGYSALALGIFVPLFIVWAIKISLPKPSRPINFPPGPPAIPFLGNLHQIPLTKPFVQFAEWGRQYGAHGLLGLQIGPSRRAVVLNTWRSVRDLLDQRGAVYSSRPYIPLVGYVVPTSPDGKDLHLVFMRYGPQWRRARRTVTDFLRDDAVDAGLRPVQHAESSQMMWEILQDPPRYDDHLLRCFGAVVLASVFGVRGRNYSAGGPLRRFFAVQHEWAGMLDQGSVPPIDVLPFLRYVPDFLTPWRGWRQRAASLKARQSSLYSELFHEAKKRVEDGKSQDSFIAGLLRDQDKDGYSMLELEYIAGFLLEGGSDTTAETFQVFILAMASHPEIQKKAQEEVDKFFGPEGVQSPHINMEELPYLGACLLEVSQSRFYPLTFGHQ
jgi:cytochrome P450